LHDQPEVERASNSTDILLEMTAARGIYLVSILLTLDIWGDLGAAFLCKAYA